MSPCCRKELVSWLGKANRSLPMLASPKRLLRFPTQKDSIVFFDGEELFEKLNGIGGFISMASNGDPNAQRAAKIITSVISECDIIDYTVTVEYTEGNQNRTSTFRQVGRRFGRKASLQSRRPRPARSSRGKAGPPPTPTLMRCRPA